MFMSLVILMFVYVALHFEVSCYTYENFQYTLLSISTSIRTVITVITAKLQAMLAYFANGTSLNIFKPIEIA